MTYFVTGATGFIGRHLLERLLLRKGRIHCLVRKESMSKFEALRERLGADKDRLVAVTGDLGKPRLGVTPATLRSLGGKITHFFHLAAVYDLSADEASQVTANIDGTRHAIQLAEALKVGCFHHTSSIAAAGLYPGVFREDMFDEAEGLDNPYFRTKHDSEGIVRKECKRPFRIYRPGIVIGNSQNGEMDKIDGPYYLFPLIKRMRELLPPWMPAIGLEGGRLNLVPVDWVAAAMDHIAHLPKLDSQCFHLTDPAPRRIGEVLNIFAHAGHAPKMSMRIDARMFAFIPGAIRQALSSLPPVRRMIRSFLTDFGIPAEIMRFINYPTRFDMRETERALRGSKIKLPKLQSYAWRLWDYWERHLDPALFVDHSLSGKVRRKVVVITGGSSGIGKAVALKVAAAGAKVVICARGEEELAAAKVEIEAAGGSCHTYKVDLADLASCDAFIEQVTADHGGVEVLINNAGRSIRRAIASSYDRFHDFERTMQLNYFGSLRLILGFLPKMTERHRGHIINISSIGVLTNAPRFSAYVSSKAALDAFSRCAQAEFSDQGINFTTINMPLVKTPMIAPTKMYESVPTLSPEEAADLVVGAIIERPVRVATRTGIFAQLFYSVSPRAYEIVMNTAFRLFPDSPAAKGIKGVRQEAQHGPSSEQVAFAALMRGVHW
ncbi:SDR family oxidoreductase [Dokdonella immobilis]|uniref:Thioester reductase domain-containing protein n=1 Tax=Dokdonella immobilis TaxID=578942 RepID=A0A1I4VYM5_9GAMM|nr:SDR family oxidoreductase [Dokdonella immobilis]SFN06250.1 Thioester reductase domain-containing protein [Dokdonella immobilis]